MQSEHVTFRLLKAGEDFLEVIDTLVHAVIAVVPAPASAVEPGVGRIHHSVQYNSIVMCVFQPSTVDMQRGKRLHTLRQQKSGGKKGKGKKKKSFHYIIMDCLCLQK